MYKLILPFILIVFFFQFSSAQNSESSHFCGFDQKTTELEERFPEMRKNRLHFFRIERASLNQLQQANCQAPFCLTERAFSPYI